MLSIDFKGRREKTQMIFFSGGDKVWNFVVCR